MSEQFWFHRMSWVEFSPLQFLRKTQCYVVLKWFVEFTSELSGPKGFFKRGTVFNYKFSFLKVTWGYSVHLFLFKWVFIMSSKEFMHFIRVTKFIGIKLFIVSSCYDFFIGIESLLLLISSCLILVFCVFSFFCLA